MIEVAVATALIACAHIFHGQRLTRAFLRAHRAEYSANTEIVGVEKASVIVCIRNGAAQWPKLWEKLRRQRASFPFEVVVVDDGSTDATPQLLDAARGEVDAPELRVVRLEDSAPGKKDAQTLGVHHAQGDWLLFTDVDCIPSGDHWLASMLEPAASGAEVVLGISWPALNNPSTGLQRMQALDAMHIARSYVGWAQLGHPYMAVGRNFAMRACRFPKHVAARHLASGDDDMAVQQLAHETDAKFASVIHRDGQADTVLPTTWVNWRKQKRRHWSTAPHYAAADQVRLLFPLGLNLALLLGSIAVIWTGVAHGVLHIALWITGGLLGCVWMMEVRNFRIIANACQAASAWNRLGWLVPLRLGWNAYSAFRMGLSRRNAAEW